MADNQEVLLTVPALPEFLRVARVTASGLASGLRFSIDEVDDLRLALDELCFALIGKGDPAGELKLSYQLTNVLTIVGQFARQSTHEPARLGEFSKQILTALVDTHSLWDESEVSCFSLTKKPAAA